MTLLHRVAQSAGIGGLDPSIAKALIDSEDPKHTLFCREIVFVAIYALFSDNKCPLFSRFGGGGSPKADIVRFFYCFSYRIFFLLQTMCV